MKSFDLLRYLKKWWFLIMLITAVGCLGVYEFISSRQSYTATAIIQYTNANASQGRNADGSKIDPTEITSASVINQTIQQLGLTASTESIRSKISVGLGHQPDHPAAGADSQHREHPLQDLRQRGHPGG